MSTLAPSGGPRAHGWSVGLVAVIALVALAAIGWITTDALWPSARDLAGWRSHRD